MRKVMLLAAMLAMVLAAAAPVVAQDVNVTTGDNVEYNAVCQNIIGQIGDITANQTGVAAAGNASAMDDSAAIAEVAQEQNVTVAQVNECLNNFATVTATSTATPTATVVAKKKVVMVHGKKAKVISIKGKKFVVVNGKTVTATATASATSSTMSGGGGSGGGGGGGGGSTASATTLPDTGGLTVPSGFALGAGALLVGGGLLARRIAR
jgi:LPXTG-motif cell wall-anchored protein